MKRYNHSTTRYDIAKNHVAKTKRLITSAIIFACFFVFCYGSKLLSFKGFNFNSISIIFWIWGLVLVVKAIKLLIFDYNWEQKEIDKQLNKNK